MRCDVIWCDALPTLLSTIKLYCWVRRNRWAYVARLSMILICRRCANWRERVTRHFAHLPLERNSPACLSPPLVTCYGFMHGELRIAHLNTSAIFVKENITRAIWIVMTFYLDPFFLNLHYSQIHKCVITESAKSSHDWDQTRQNLLSIVYRLLDYDSSNYNVFKY